MLRYAELHCKTNFSFLEGASHADELVARAEELDYTAIAVTDRNSLAGVVRAHGAVRQLAPKNDPQSTQAASHERETLSCEVKSGPALKLIVGAEITLVDAPHVVLWAPDRAAYGRLSRLITVGRRRADKGDCSLAFDDLVLHADGLLAGIVPPPRGEPTGGFGAYRELFGDRVYLLAECNRGPDDAERLEWLMGLARAHRLPLLAAGDVHYHVARRKKLHDVLTAIRHGTTVDQAGRRLQPNAQRHLQRIDDIVARFARLPDAVDRTVEVANRCHFSLDQLRYEYPRPDVPPGETPLDYLRRLTWEGAGQRYPHGISDKVRHLLNHELTLIGTLCYEAYFLTVWDLVRFARSRQILCQGRGSAANSAVCYCLGITAVDPEQTDVLFERFISRERDEAPDIDVDFEHQRREEVLQYLYARYGRERAGIAAEVICYRPRSAVRDVGKGLGFSADRVDALAKQLEGTHHEPDLSERCRQCGIDPTSRMGRMFVTLVEELIGFPRHLSQHVGGMVITRGPLCELVPIENGAMPDRTVIEWDKDDLDELGILKIDCLSLGILTAIRRAFSLVERHHGQPLTLAGIPQDDPRVYDMICRADTMGVFQIESRAQ
ncbi:MAG: PHP domain-containing protein, partial [Pirellulales bacterium]